MTLAYTPTVPLGVLEGVWGICQLPTDQKTGWFRQRAQEARRRGKKKNRKPAYREGWGPEEGLRSTSVCLPRRKGYWDVSPQPKQFGFLVVSLYFVYLVVWQGSERSQMMCGKTGCTGGGSAFRRSAGRGQISFKSTLSQKNVSTEVALNAVNGTV